MGTQKTSQDFQLMTYWQVTAMCHATGPKDFHTVLQHDDGIYKASLHFLCQSKTARGPTHEERVHGSWAVNEEEATVAARRRPLFGSAPALICWL